MTLPLVFWDTKMILRTDTIGHFEKPTETNIREGISYPGENATENDIDSFSWEKTLSQKLLEKAIGKFSNFNKIKELTRTTPFTR